MTDYPIPNDAANPIGPEDAAWGMPADYDAGSSPVFSDEMTRAPSPAFYDDSVQETLYAEEEGEYSKYTDWLTDNVNVFGLVTVPMWVVLLVVASLGGLIVFGVLYWLAKKKGRRYFASYAGQRW